MSIILEGIKSGFGSIVRSPKSGLLNCAVSEREEPQTAPQAPLQDSETAAVIAMGSVLWKKDAPRRKNSQLPPAMEVALKRALRNSGIYYKSCDFDLAGTSGDMTRVMAFMSEATIPGCALNKGEQLSLLLFHIRRSPGGSISVLLYPAASESSWLEGKGFSSHNSTSGYFKAFSQALDGFIRKAAPSFLREFMAT